MLAAAPPPTTSHVFRSTVTSEDRELRFQRHDRPAIS